MAHHIQQSHSHTKAVKRIQSMPTGSIQAPDNAVIWELLSRHQKTAPCQRFHTPIPKALIFSRVADFTLREETTAPIQELPKKYCPKQTQLCPCLPQTEAPHLGLFSCDAVNSKASLGIVHQAEMLACLVNADDV